MRNGNEQCDPNDPNRVGFGPEGCSQSCQPTNSVACVPGPTTGSFPAPITSSEPGLCPAGQQVTRFTQTPNGNGLDYTWACGNSQV